MDLILSKEAARIKGFDSQVSGDADIILSPNITTANAVFKLMVLGMGCCAAGLVLGAKVPILLTSRAQAAPARIASAALGVIAAKGPGMILVVNAGSSSIKVELFDLGLTSILEGKVTEIGGDARIKLGKRAEAIAAPDHKAGFGAILDTLEAHGHPVTGLTAAAHRIVHGGADLTDPVHLSAKTLTQIEQFNTLAPLHNPHNLSAIRALAELMPDLPQYASFDTAFHAGNDALATTYAIPASRTCQGDPPLWVPWPFLRQLGRKSGPRPAPPLAGAAPWQRL